LFGTSLVYPDDDEYALEHEGEYGKNECWYVVQAEPGAKIVYGHTAMTPEEFARLRGISVSDL